MKIGIVGITGRMGQAVAHSVLEHPNLELCGASDSPSSPMLGRDIGDCVGREKFGTIVNSDPIDAFQDAEAIIDFSTPYSTLINAEFAAQARIVHVVGTTGMNAEEILKLKAAARHSTTIHAGNMSIGINILEAMTSKLASSLGVEFDIEVIEYHHRHKVDAPSGTALMLGEAAARGRDKTLEEIEDRGRDGITGARREGDIGFAAIRGGDIIGEHDVLFAGPSERITLKHQATDRRLFANGAIRAALWGRDQKPGYYNMHDVLGLGHI